LDDANEAKAQVVKAKEKLAKEVALREKKLQNANQ